jgi:hypothetical protein
MDLYQDRILPRPIDLAIAPPPVRESISRYTGSRNRVAKTVYMLMNRSACRAQPGEKRFTGISDLELWYCSGARRAMLAGADWQSARRMPSCPTKGQTHVGGAWRRPTSYEALYPTKTPALG